jgi:hypothetical protein
VVIIYINISFININSSFGEKNQLFVMNLSQQIKAPLFLIPFFIISLSIMTCGVYGKEEKEKKKKEHNQL